MGRIIALTTLILTACLGTLAAASPEVAVDRPVFDFGTIPQGKKVEHTFILKNKGSTSLTIKNTRTSCGCTVASVSSSVIQPGKSAEIKASFDSSNFFGNITKTISVETNDPKNTVYTLTLKGTVVEEIVVTPRQVNLGTLRVGIAKEMAISIENRGSKQIQLTEVKSSLSQVVVKTAKNVVNPGSTGTIMLNATPRNEDRMLSGYLTIKTNSPNKPLITIPVFGSVAK
jgi:hypothetical protein